MSESLCCTKCIGNRDVAENVIPSLTADTSGSVCGYCGRGGTLARPEDLRAWFEAITDEYPSDTQGQPLLTVLRREWLLFPNDATSDSVASKLLDDILDNPGAASRPVSIPPQKGLSSAARWDLLREELMHRNRWFLAGDLNIPWLEHLLRNVMMPATDLPTDWFRARVERGTALTSADMGAPPRERTGQGRANPAGIRYLYVGSTQMTAITEVRPQPGERVAVASISLTSPRVLDLREPRRSVAPSRLAEGDTVRWVREQLGLLDRLGMELTRPVVPSATSYAYTPSQYLCELIKYCGYDGVAYRSSMSEGFNLAVFDPELATVGDIVTVDVDRVVVELADETSV